MPFLAGAIAALLTLAATRAQPAVQPESLDTGFIVVVSDLAKRATADSPIYMASNRSGWDPGDPGWKLQPRSDGKWQIFVPPHPEGLRMEFKFARGNWDLVEADANLDDIANRHFDPIPADQIVPGQPPTVELIIAAWHDQRPDANVTRTGRYAPINATGTVKRLEVQNGAMRDALVWLPPGYDDPANAARTYPVLYLQDGQNIFDRPAGGIAPAEWGADETATRLIESGEIQPIIIVAIPNAGAERIAEYSPVPILPNTEARGDVYVAFLVREVMPRVERAFRVKTGPENTAIGGSSLGALISMHAATKRPDLFGMVIAESPSLLVGDGVAEQYFRQIKTWPARVFIGVSTQELGPRQPERNEACVQAARRLAEWVRDHGADVKLVVGEGEHNEIAWAKRFPEALTFLFGR
jgi:predicted alpha/beta superfamily hydrolase